jgi:hypothetical protein
MRQDVSTVRIPNALARAPIARKALIDISVDCARQKRSAHGYVPLPPPWNGTDTRVLVKAVYSVRRRRTETVEHVLLEPARTQDEIDMIAWDERRKAAGGGDGDTGRTDGADDGEGGGGGEGGA